MGFPLVPSIDDYTPAFPGAAYTPHDFQPYEGNGTNLSETGTVPASADSTGRRRVNLAQVPLDLVTTAITVGGSPREKIPYGEAPTAGRVAVSLLTGAMEFHSSDASGTWAATYKGKGTPLQPHLFNQIGAELEATQEKALEIEGELDDVAADVAAHETDLTTGVLAALKLLTLAANKLPYFSSSSEAALTDITAAARSFLAAADAAAQRAALGLGALATASSVNNGDWSGTDLAVANGGTGASDAAGARTNLGLGTAATQNTGAFLANIGASTANAIALWNGTGGAAIKDSEITVSGKKILDLVEFDPTNGRLLIGNLSQTRPTLDSDVVMSLHRNNGCVMILSAEDDHCGYFLGRRLGIYDEPRLAGIYLFSASATEMIIRSNGEDKLLVGDGGLLPLTSTYTCGSALYPWAVVYTASVENGEDGVEIGGTGGKVAFYGGTPVAQQTFAQNLLDSTGGSPGSELQSYSDTVIDNNFATLAAEIDDIKTKLDQLLLIRKNV